MCSGALKEVLHWYYLMPQHQPVIDQVLPRIAQMQPLAKEAVETRDFEMCQAASRSSSSSWAMTTSSP